MAAQERAQAENLAADVEVNPAGGQGGGIQDQPIVSDEVPKVPQEKLKKSRRSKKPPRVPTSDGIIRLRFSPVRAVLTDGISESVIDDSKTAAWFANIQYHGHEGPLPAALVADPNFGLMSRHGSMHFAAANRLARKLYHHGEVSRKSCSDAQTRLGIKMDHRKSVEFELQAYQRRCVEAEERAVEESAKASILQRQLADEKTGITSRIKRATKAAMRTLPLTKAEAWLPNVAGGDVEFDSLFAGLESDFVISPISSDSSGTARDNVSLETLAADVGVRAFNGSMTDELGMNHDDDEYVNIDD
ncbi:hypothetical protein AALP_AAs74222U000100 [Arabis alpina]|uniref:Uncharacterized protein n=1 Tax=Arabis alpina TaxID=50452 RepID=A0A087G390_ARAAL|nr:hypothetical protein AALP_AAs74222U000100 [Arabis alpina]